uniref:uncharacterized protein LOC128932472 n=1 Tax=Callithrix jacchus TaxID=9483 RepID=UPI0023DD3C1C|nr:uncharacterized protein LOC128932472 [Callithrix jacchus]
MVKPGWGLPASSCSLSARPAACPHSSGRICGAIKRELRGYWSLTHCQYFGRNNILQIVTSTQSRQRAGRPLGRAERPGIPARVPAPRAARSPPPRARRALAPLQIIFTGGVWLCAGRGCAPKAVGHSPRRGFKCVRVWTTRLQECVLSSAHPLPGVQRIRGPGDPSSRPSRLRWAARLGPDPARRSPVSDRCARARAGHRVPASPRPRSRPTHGAPAPIVEAPPGKEVRLPLQATPRRLGNRQEMTRTASLRLCLALLKTSSSHQSLAFPFPESPVQVCKEGCEI